MKLTILTQYFPPEVGAPQNRLFELAERLNARGVEIVVITAMPNYPKMEIQEGYRGKWYVKETMGNLTVHRCAIFVSKNKSIPIRLLNYFSFVFTSLWIGLFKTKRADFLLCESPPLFLGISAVILSRLKRSRLIFNASDLWPESAEKLGLVTNKTFLKLATWLEEWLYRKSFLITGQTQGIVKDISTRFPFKDVYWLPNGVDPTLFDQSTIRKSDWRAENGYTENDFILIYAGIIGYAQGLDIIIDAASKLREQPSVKFVLLGNGPEKERLVERVGELSLTSVKFLDFVQKKEMPAILKEVNASIVPLRKLDLFKGAIPSKLFECLASEKPILLGVDGEARQLFIEQGKAGLYFEPENVTELVEAIVRLKQNPEECQQLGVNGKKYVSTYFSRDKIAEKLWQKLGEISK